MSDSPHDIAASGNPLLTARQLATRLNVSVAYVYRYKGPGRVTLPGGLVRFDYDKVIAAAEEGVAS